MRLLFFSTVYPSPSAPARGIYNQTLLEALALDHEVRVVAPLPWPLLLRGRRPAGEPFLEPRLSCSRPIYLYPPAVGKSLHGRLLWWSARGVVRRLVRGFRPDAVLSYWAHPDGEAAVRAGASAGAPVVLLVGGSDVLLLPKDPARRRSIVRVLTSVEAVLAVGAHLRQSVVNLGVPESRVHVYRRGVSERFCPGDRLAARRALHLPLERKTLLWVGNMVPVKAVDVLLQAARQLVREGLDLQVCLVGEGPLRTGLEARARDSLPGRVAFAGAIGHDRLPDFYRAADLTVLPSLSEGTPNVLLESLACGTPFVASRVGGVPALSRHPEDELVPAGDAEALAKALRRQLAAPRPPPGSEPPFAWRDSARLVTDVIRGLGAASPPRGGRP